MEVVSGYLNYAWDSNDAKDFLELRFARLESGEFLTVFLPKTVALAAFERCIAKLGRSSDMEMRVWKEYGWMPAVSVGQYILSLNTIYDYAE